MSVKYRHLVSWIPHGNPEPRPARELTGHETLILTVLQTLGGAAPRGTVVAEARAQGASSASAYASVVSLIKAGRIRLQGKRKGLLEIVSQQKVLQDQRTNFGL
ncbi:hypothetical protein SEA_SHAGRAT_99 [Rhodococcus phage Shagrat]|nr:hypothetical protein SEA_SHAGRAT_99 [Rhodococcus phage Shagrat]